VEEVPVFGQPDPERICTSIVERSNLSTRMSNRRFTRLTNAFSKKWENHWAAVACWFAFYNFCRVHKSLRCTPAMEAGIADHVWSMRELLIGVRELPCIAMADSEQRKTIECEMHGPAFQAFICTHLATDPKQIWYSSNASEEDQWPDAWCSLCHEAFQREGEWNDKNENGLAIKLFCHRCYESHRA
jgi:hypothetical protein